MDVEPNKDRKWGVPSEMEQSFDGSTKLSRTVTTLVAKAGQGS